MTFRKATPQETKDWLGKGLVMPGPKQPASSPMQPAEDSLVDRKERLMPPATGGRSPTHSPQPGGSPRDEQT